MTDDIQNIPAQQPDAEPGGASNLPIKARVTEEQVRDMLRYVVDPEIGMDVIALGLIREIDLQPDHTHVVMIMTTPFCPYAPQLLEQVRRTVLETTGVPTTIEMGLEQWSPELMEEGAGEDWGLFY
jgi:metal-sulfur cluster biosynthetic enzyme